jgi:hypothetical protein
VFLLEGFTAFLFGILAASFGVKTRQKFWPSKSRDEFSLSSMHAGI